MEFHEGLNLPYYTHFTSPIRRFADFVNHQQLKQSIRSQSQLYTSDQVGELVFHINDKIEQVLSLQSNYLSEVGARRKVRTINRQEGRFPQVNDIGIAIRQKIKHKKSLPHIYKDIILLEISRSKHIEPWFLEYFLPSGELEIKNALKEKILSHTTYFKYLKILKNLKILDYLIEFSEEERSYSIYIYFEGEGYYFDTVIDDSNKENFDFERKLWKTFLIQETLKKALTKILSLL